MLVDINTSIGLWPFTDLPTTTANELEAQLRAHSIDRALVSHLGAVFNLDPQSSNTQLLQETSSHEMLHPVVTINPAMPGWKVHLDQLRQRHGANVVKVYPQYHNYSLTSDIAAELVSYLIEHGMKLLVCMRLEDERTRYFGLNVVGLPVEDVISLHREFPDYEFVCLNAYLPEIRTIASSTTGIGVDTSFADWFLVMDELLDVLPAERIHFGSHSPFLYTGASVDKVKLAELDASQRTLITAANTMAFAGISVQ